MLGFYKFVWMTHKYICYYSVFFTHSIDCNKSRFLLIQQFCQLLYRFYQAFYLPQLCQVCSTTEFVFPSYCFLRHFLWVFKIAFMIKIRYLFGITFVSHFFFKYKLLYKDYRSMSTHKLSLVVVVVCKLR